jgi:hypothetical protein
MKVADYDAQAEMAWRLANSAATPSERDALIKIARLWENLAADRKAEPERKR